MIALILAAAIAQTSLAPPPLHAPIIIQLGTGRTVTKMDPNQDYLIKFPNSPKNGSTILMGGRNIVMIGGQITVPAEDATRRALFIKGATGTVHVEGLLIDNPSESEFDAIVIAAPNAEVQIKNVRIEGLKGFQNTWHSDVIQPWGGVKALRVDGLSATTGYQGIQLSSLKAPIGSIKLQNVNLRSIDPQIWTSGLKGGNGGYLFWADCTLTARISLSNVYLAPRPERNLKQVAWPIPSANSKCPSRIDSKGTAISFPALPISGSVQIGQPPNGDFVPVGAAGLRYRSANSR